jgi:hypothetical protein
MVTTPRRFLKEAKEVRPALVMEVPDPGATDIP